MNTLYRFTLGVECPDGKRHVEAFNIEAYAARQWEPYDLCDNSLCAMMAGGVMKMGALRIDAEREKLAKQIAAKLTAAILKAIKARDLHNGYPQGT